MIIFKYENNKCQNHNDGEAGIEDDDDDDGVMREMKSDEVFCGGQKR